MTNKTAIRVLEHIEHYLKTHTCESCEEEHMAIALAIKALEETEKSQGDCISREGLLDEFETKCERFCSACEYQKFNSNLNRYECELINTAESVKFPERPQANRDIRWTDKLSVDNDGNIRDFSGNIVGHYAGLAEIQSSDNDEVD